LNHIDPAANRSDPMRRLLKKLFTPPLMWLAALIMFTEEVLWETLKHLMARLGRLPVIHRVEARIVRLPPYAAAALFLVPGCLLLPLKIGALCLITSGHALLGAEIIIAAKIVGTALVARIFTLTRPQLITLKWFAAIYQTIMRWRATLYAWVGAHPGWQKILLLRARFKAGMAKLRPGRIGLRLRAIQRLKRRTAFR
jgi:hypothetical protein